MVPFALHLTFAVPADRVRWVSRDITCRRRRAACGAGRSRVQYPLAAQGHRPARPAGPFSCPAPVDRVCARQPSTASLAHDSPSRAFRSLRPRVVLDVASRFRSGPGDFAGLTRQGMSMSYRPYAPGQMSLLPATPQDRLPAGHLAHFILDTVDALDLKAFYARYAGGGPRNQPFHPARMVKVRVYADATGVSARARSNAGCTSPGLSDAGARRVWQPSPSRVARGASPCRSTASIPPGRPGRAFPGRGRCPSPRAGPRRRPSGRGSPAAA